MSKKISQRTSGSPGVSTDELPIARSGADYKLTIAQILAVTHNCAFPATQVPSADANTLDDYEEGTATSTITAGSGTFTTVSGSCRYTKVGDRVLFNETVTITTNGTAATYVQGTMPFTAAATQAATGTNLSTGSALSGYVTSGNIIIFKYDATYPGASATTLEMSGHYRV